MKTICFYFQLHIPMLLRRYRFLEIGQDHYYFDDFANESNVQHLAQTSILPTNRLLLELIKTSKGKFKAAVSISGLSIEMFEQFAPEVIESFVELANTGNVEFIAEPYAHSLASLFDVDEFIQQVEQHSNLMNELFGVKPTTFRNTEMIYSDEIGEVVHSMGFKTILTEGSKQVLGWKSPNFMYGHPTIPELKILVRNMRLSDDIGFRFSDRSWSDFPLTAEKLMNWIKSTDPSEQIFNLFMGYPTFGERQKAESGIFDFMRAIPFHALANRITFSTPAEITKKYNPISSITLQYPQSWSGEEKDVSHWTGNIMQTEALQKLYNQGERVRLCSDRSIKHDWLCLQCSDHFHFMTTKPWNSFNVWPNYESPFAAFTNFMNVLSDFMSRVNEQYPSSIDNEELNALLTTIYNQELKISELEKQLKHTDSTVAVTEPEYTEDD
ncbi:MAG: glycoside hydrolase family 57 protein [Microbacter sp.]